MKTRLLIGLALIAAGIILLVVTAATVKAAPPPPMNRVNELFRAFQMHDWKTVCDIERYASFVKSYKQCVTSLTKDTDKFTPFTYKIVATPKPKGNVSATEVEVKNHGSTNYIWIVLVKYKGKWYLKGIAGGEKPKPAAVVA